MMTASRKASTWASEINFLGWVLPAKNELPPAMQVNESQNEYCREHYVLQSRFAAREKRRNSAAKR